MFVDFERKKFESLSSKCQCKAKPNWPSHFLQNLSKQTIYFQHSMPATAGKWWPEQSVIGPDGVLSATVQKTAISNHPSWTIMARNKLHWGSKTTLRTQNRTAVLKEILQLSQRFFPFFWQICKNLISNLNQNMNLTSYDVQKTFLEFPAKKRGKLKYSLHI